MTTGLSSTVSHKSRLVPNRGGAILEGHVDFCTWAFANQVLPKYDVYLEFGKV